MSVQQTVGRNKNIRDLYRGINQWKKGYQPTTSLVQDGMSDLIADFHIFNMKYSFFFQLLNINRVMEVRPIELHTPQPFVPDRSPLEFENATAKLNGIHYQVFVQFRQS
jgi:hypothetical protein